MEQPQPPAAAKSLVDAAVAVIRSPKNFYAEMPKSGGFGEPLIFLVAMGVVVGLVQAVLGLAGLHPGIGLIAAAVSVIMTPILVAVFGFIGAAVLFGIWKLMGSQESYETAYRCAAYSTAIAPINAVLSAVPYVGIAIGTIWGAFVMIEASVETHKIRVEKARLVFGTLAAALIVMSLSAQWASRTLMSRQAAAMQAEGAQMAAASAQLQAGAAQMQAQMQALQQAQAAARAASGAPTAPGGLSAQQQAQFQQMRQAMEAAARRMEAQRKAQSPAPPAPSGN
ncbi:MAG: YIP1 family protein [Elusimicrobia bacterium]|nr:YIP1 family protein [Elusimicrobiota bacterium]